MSDCSIEECDRGVDALGWCASHYKRWRRHGDPRGGRPRPRTPTETLEEVLWLREGGASPFEVVEALGVKAETLQRAMLRIGREDLSQWVQREQTWQSGAA